jgi:hypothetical protein
LPGAKRATRRKCGKSLRDNKKKKKALAEPDLQRIPKEVLPTPRM